MQYALSSDRDISQINKQSTYYAACTNLTTKLTIYHISGPTTNSIWFSISFFVHYLQTNSLLSTIFDMFFTSIFIGMFLLEISNVQIESCAGSETDRRKKLWKTLVKFLNFGYYWNFSFFIFGQFKQLQNNHTSEYVVNRSNDVSDYLRVCSKNTKIATILISTLNMFSICPFYNQQYNCKGHFSKYKIEKNWKKIKKKRHLSSSA